MATSKTQNKAVIVETPIDYGNPQPNWDRKKFDDAISDKGYQCTIERALRCPCSNKPTGQALSDCLNCSGSGWFFIDKQKTVVVCTSMSNRNKYEVWSPTNMGIVNISSRAQDKLGFMDRLVLTELESWFTQVLQMNRSKTDITKYFAFLVYEPVQIYDVYLYKDSSTPLIYVEPGQYSISNSKITINKSFTDSQGITIPSITIRYTHNPAFHVIDINRDLIKQKSISDAGIGLVNFPLSSIAKRAHFMFENVNFDGEGIFDNTNYNREPIKYDY